MLSRGACDKWAKVEKIDAEEEESWIVDGASPRDIADHRTVCTAHSVSTRARGGSDYSFAGEEPARRPGARAMEKWLAKTWEQVMERTLPARLERKEKVCHQDDRYTPYNGENSPR
jgi:hypothetical protein